MEKLEIFRTNYDGRCYSELYTLMRLTIAATHLLHISRVTPPPRSPQFTHTTPRTPYLATNRPCDPITFHRIVLPPDRLLKQ